MQSEFAKQMAEIAQNDDTEANEPLTVEKALELKERTNSMMRQLF